MSGYGILIFLRWLMERFSFLLTNGTTSCSISPISPRLKGEQVGEWQARFREGGEKGILTESI